MEKVFKQYKKMQIIHPTYKGYVCGYNDSHIIIAVETTNKDFFRKIDNPYILDEYKDSKYRYVFEDERELINQSKYETNKNTYLLHNF